MDINLDAKLWADLAHLAAEVGHSVESYIKIVLAEWVLREKEANEIFYKKRVDNWQQIK